METSPADRTAALQQRNQRIRFVLFAILLANWFVAGAKLIFGFMSQSAAVTADGLHSFIDGSSNVLGLVAMGVASRPADDDHPYGHGKFEALASLGIGAMIGIGMLELGRMALDSLMHDRHAEVTPAMAGVMVVTLVINLVVTRVERHYGERYKSTLLLADASHTLSDVFVTIAVLASLGLVALGYPKADGVVALVVMVFVAWVAYGIVRQAVGILSDTARLDAAQVAQHTMAVSGVRSCRDVRSRGMEESVYVDLKIEVDPELTTAQAHEVADRVERTLHAAYPQVVDVVVHVEPEHAPPARADVSPHPG
ncbi:cation diffusion facilitator family transporter [Myxococcus sp. K15C18031901]|uniref:cation diffusion facilitator family transporter n=1 Tax=Myxococcus dinghuensis TaxID=2906761 RepID=UPI0020A75454|nr:cation diffusion facilitator family transporter [Myxococcus dinghuensis]MCP3101243.1 cation diffusion facilitator family transporter [Myxococcus dinghuensis]